MAKKPFLLRAFDFFLAVFGVGEVENKDIDAVVRTVHDPGGKLRLGIYHRMNNTYIYREEFYNTKVLDMVWEPGQTGPDEGYETAEEALKAARAAFPWVDSVLAENT